MNNYQLFSEEGGIGEDGKGQKYLEEEREKTFLFLFHSKCIKSEIISPSISLSPNPVSPSFSHYLSFSDKVSSFSPMQ